MQTMQQMSQRRIVAQTYNRLGNAYLVLEEWEKALAAFEQGLNIWSQMSHPNEIEAKGGRALALWRLQRADEALRMADEVLEFVGSYGIGGAMELVLLMAHCGYIFEAIDCLERRQLASENARVWIDTVASRISDERVRSHFLQSQTEPLAHRHEEKL